VMPTICVTTFSVDLRIDLLATGRFITAFPRSVVNVKARQFPLKALPVHLPTRPWPVELITLKHRTLNPVVERFVEHLRAFAKSLDPALEQQSI
jgi:DNA-binding transcriptional LysR family regulator